MSVTPLRQSTPTQQAAYDFVGPRLSEASDFARYRQSSDWVASGANLANQVGNLAVGAATGGRLSLSSDASSGNGGMNSTENANFLAEQRSLSTEMLMLQTKVQNESNLWTTRTQLHKAMHEAARTTITNFK